MVAATFPNLSFENPPGTGPTLVTPGAEPFALVDLDNLIISFAGITTNVVFLEADFAAISSATAVEIANVLEAQVEDLGAADDGGFLRLTSLLTGDDVTLEVTGGTANVELGFSMVAVTGEAYAGGPPDGWAILVETYSSQEWAGFTDQNTRPEEIFSDAGWATLVFTGTVADAIFDLASTPTPFETFAAWSDTGFLESFVGLQATFGQGLAEDYESGWGLPTYFTFISLQAALVNPEDYETGWGNGPTGAFGGDTLFAGGTKSAEDFENIDPGWYAFTIITAVAGEWSIEINGITHKYTASGGDSEIDIATGLENIISTASVVANVQQSGALLALAPVNTNLDLAISGDRPAGGEFNFTTLVEEPTSVSLWVGQDINHDFD